jgi:hypothetical protein
VEGGYALYRFQRLSSSMREVNDSECQTPISGGKTYWNRLSPGY